ncbi:MAG: hypothetical protein GEV03_03695 [Streptosporangiales bacterium]|nr:hypothetical protein [Streptosporangiales bacterium]
MHRTWKTALTTLAAAGLLLGGAATAASAGSPDGTSSEHELSASESAAVPAGTLPGSPPCKATLGNLLATYKHGKWAKLEIYWDNAHKTNCAYLRHGPKVPDGQHETYVLLFTCKTSTKGKPCKAIKYDPPRYDYDGGPYTTYAGKVSVKAAGKCIFARGAVKAGGEWRRIDSLGRKGLKDPKGNHCG